MESYVISDGQISASSQWDNNHAAIQGRLNFKAGSGKRGGWSSKHNDVNQWLQIDLGDPNTDVTGLATQGRNAHSQWVTKYKMQYSVDGINFQYYVEQGAEKVIYSTSLFSGETFREYHLGKPQWPIHFNFYSHFCPLGVLVIASLIVEYRNFPLG